MGTPIRLAAIMPAVFTFSACSTVADLGKDVERGGEILQDTARDVQKKDEIECGSSTLHGHRCEPQHRFSFGVASQRLRLVRTPDEVE